MGPPLSSKPLKEGSKSEMDLKEEEELIAYRTRSKLPLKDTPLEEIEANFVFPDLFPDLNDNTEACDPEWLDWLAGLHSGKLFTQSYSSTRFQL